MKWIIGEKVNVDRVACPWLFRKFMRPEAEIIVYDALHAEGHRHVARATP